jgi:hypothetical protein
VPKVPAPAYLLCAVLLVCGCGAAERPGRYAPRAEGCEVTVFPEAPGGPTDNLGPVRATCSEDVSNDDCLRTLKDAACRLGGDVVWGVKDTPEAVGGKKRLSGRAAHTRGAGAAPPPRP